MQVTPTFSSSAQAVLNDLKNRFPDTPFLALGQTALWDEPTKAALYRALTTLWPSAKMIVGVHDTDYFAKLPGHPAMKEEGKYALVSHDDGATKGLWSAAGEMSRLFGSEDVADRHQLERRGGVSLHHALRSSEDTDALLSDLTAAWGWTGIIHTEHGRRIAREVPLHDILPTLLEQIDWATQGSVACLRGERRSAEAVEFALSLREEVETFAHANPCASLTDLYQYLLPRIYERLLGAPAANLTSTSTMELLRFNSETANLPRFAFVDLFLNPVTKQRAMDAYNLGVGGSDTYTLDKFGEGALPFDLVVPGRGRGTLRILPDGTVLADTPTPIILCGDNCNLMDVEGLAKLVEQELGPNVALVGKAVSLIPLLAAEFTLVFHEGASGYTDRTYAMMRHLADSRVKLPTLRPILRVQYATWDSLAAIVPDNEDSVEDEFRLPDFLKQSFGFPTVDFADFAVCWRRTLTIAEQELDDLSKRRSPRDLMDLLLKDDLSRWSVLQQKYEATRERLLTIWHEAESLQNEVDALYEKVRAWRTEAVTLEREKGDDFRFRLQPLRDEMIEANPDELSTLQARFDSYQVEREYLFDQPIAELRAQVKEALATIRDLKTQRLAIERAPDTEAARNALRQLEAGAERERAVRARNALQTINGMPHADRRPSAWWFPLVDGSGAWFNRVSETAEYRLEELV